MTRLPASAETHSSEERRDEPRANWIPLRDAVFKFGMTEDDEAAGIHDKPFLGLSKDNFAHPGFLHQKLQNREANDAEAAKRATTPFSRSQLAKMLERQSGAHCAEIDSNTLTFLFSFRSGSIMGAAPWGFLAERRIGDAQAEPRLDAEALFNKEGLIRIPDEEAAEHEKQFESARKAAGLVFRQFMIRSFDRAVSTKTIALYGRSGAVSADFRPLPADMWLLFEVADWENGVAVGPDGTVYWSIHAEQPSTEMSSPATAEVTATPAVETASPMQPASLVPTDETAARKPNRRGARPKYDWDEIEILVFQLMNDKGEFREWDVGSGWCVQADLERKVLNYFEDRVERGKQLDSITKLRAPGEGHIRKNVAIMLARWRTKQGPLKANN
jgi:hypothetical protein